MTKYTLIVLCPEGRAPVGETQKKILNAVFSDSELKEGVTYIAGPQLLDPKEVLKNLKKTSKVAYIHLEEDEWKVTSFSGEAVEAFRKLLKKSQTDSYTLCKEFVESCLI